MSVGLVRSETGKDLRTLAAAGASSVARRTVTAATAGGLAFLGAVLGTVGGYVACISWFNSTRYTGLAALGYVPVNNLLLILVGMPLLAIVVGWLLAGREPPAMAHQPIE
jgi:putative ABC transport system permease protein